VSEEIDRFDAEVIADLLDLPVEVIPEDSESLTRQLWDVVIGDAVQMPEDVNVRWELLLHAYFGLGYGLGLL
jgi:hypothetical protein